MELKQLEYFRAIVDAGTISGAARDLHRHSLLSAIRSKCWKRNYRCRFFFVVKKESL